MQAALRFLAHRPRSEMEVRRRLARAYTAEAIQAVIDRLRKWELLNDAAFAAYWVDQRQSFRPRGERLLRLELRRLGVSSETPIPIPIDPEVDAYRAASKFARHLKVQDEGQFRARVGQHLRRRGFDWDVISPTVERLWDDVSTSSDSAPAPTA